MANKEPQIKKLRIGNVEVDNNLILAPMAGVTDLPFRLLCREQGCGLLYRDGECKGDPISK